MFLLVTNSLTLWPVRLGLEIASTLYRLYPKEYRLEAAKTLLGSTKALTRIQAGEEPVRVRSGEPMWIGESLQVNDELALRELY